MSSIENNNNNNTETKKLEIPNDLNTLTVVQLKSILQSRDLPVTGTKPVLIKRLETLKEIENATADEEEVNDDTTDENKETTSTSTTTSTTSNEENNNTTNTTTENREEKTAASSPTSPTQVTENVNTTNVNNEETTNTENKEEQKEVQAEEEEEYNQNNNNNDNEDPDLVGELLGSDDNQGNQYSDDEDETTTNENGNGSDNTTNENGSSSTSTSTTTDKKDDLNSVNVDSSVIDKAILESDKMTTEKMTSEKKREDSLDKTKIQQSVEEMEESFKKVPSIRISGLNDTITEKELNEALSEHGKVLTISYEGPKKDVAIVQMENHTAAKEKLTNTKLKNCTLTVTDVELADSLLFVGNLGNDLNRDQLRKMFEKHGDIDRVIIIKNKRTGESKGYGFVDFRTKLQANTAKSTLGSIVYNRRTLRVDWAENCNTMESMHSKTIFVDRLPRSFAEVPALRKLFSSHGKIKDCNVVPNYFGQPRGFAFIDYTTVDEAEKAQRMMNEKDLQGYKIRVNFANPSKPGFSLIKPPAIQQRDQGARGNDITNPNGGYKSGRGRGSMGGPSNQGYRNGGNGYRGNQNYGPPPPQDHHYNGGGRRGGNMHHHQMDRHYQQPQHQMPPHHHSPLPIPHHQQHPNHYQQQPPHHQQPPYGYGGNGPMGGQHFNDRSRNQNFYPPQHMNPAIVNGGGSPNHHGIPPNLSPSGVGMVNGNNNNSGGAANSKALAQYKQQIHLMEQKIKTQQEALERAAQQQQQAAQQQKQREAAIIKQQQQAAQQQAAQIAAQQQQATQERLRKQQEAMQQQQQQQLLAQQQQQQAQLVAAQQKQQMQKYYNQQQQQQNALIANKQSNLNSLATSTTTPTIPGATNVASQNSAALNYQNWQQYYTPEQAAAWAYYAQANPHLYPGYSQQDISAYYASFQQQGVTTEQQQQVGQKRQYDNTGMYNQQTTSTSTYNTHNTHNNNIGGHHQNHDNKRNRH